jgi:hypothetical protein
MALALLPRYLNEVGDKDAVGPQRLWGAAALVALLMTFTSAFIVTPRLHAARARMAAPVESVPQDHPDRRVYAKAHGLSRQLMGIRLLLALGLAAGVAALPRGAKARDPLATPGEQA